MVDINHFDPHSVEGQFSLMMASYLAHAYQPRSVHLYTEDPQVAIAAALRLPWARKGLSIQHEPSRDAVALALDIDVKTNDSAECDVALVLFARRRYALPPRARHLVMVERNALSYKSLLYPGQIRDHALAQLRWFRHSYRIDHRIGMFGLRSLVNWSISLAAGARSSPAHFLYGQRAMDHLFISNPAWWLGYIIILSGSCHS